MVAAGIAKKEELLYVRDREDPIALARTSPALLLIQRIRDEAHRFAVTFHRSRRSKGAIASQLVNVTPTDPVTFTIVGAFLLLVGLAHVAVLLAGRSPDPYPSRRSSTLTGTRR